MALLGDPASRTRTGLLLLLGYMLWTAVQLRRLERPSFGGSEFFEDTADGTGTRFRVLKRARQTQRMFVTVEALVRARAPGFYDGLPGSLPLHSHKEDETVVVRRGVLAYVIQEEDEGAGAGGGGGAADKGSGGSGDSEAGGGGKSGGGKSGGGNSGGAASARPRRAGAGDSVFIRGGLAHTYHNPVANESLLIEIIHAPAPPLGEGFYESWAGLSRSYGGAQRIHPLQMVLLLHDAGARLRGAAAPFAFASERVLPHVARALGFRSTYPEYASGAAAAARDRRDREPESEASPRDEL